MKHIKLAVVLCLCSSAVFAETTLEILQQRAEVGDAEAQTLLGLVYTYGYSVPRNAGIAKEWFAKAAMQNDQFAKARLGVSGNSVTPVFKTSGSLQNSLLRMPLQDIQKKIDQAFSAPYEGAVDFDQLVLNRDQYVGKVINLSFTTIVTIGGPTGGNLYIYVCDPKSYSGQSGSSDRLYLCGEDALRWKLDIDKKPPGTASTVCALVEKDGLIAMGARQRKTENGYEYKW